MLADTLYWVLAMSRLAYSAFDKESVELPAAGAAYILLPTFWTFKLAAKKASKPVKRILLIFINQVLKIRNKMNWVKYQSETWVNPNFFDAHLLQNIFQLCIMLM